MVFNQHYQVVDLIILIILWTSINFIYGLQSTLYLGKSFTLFMLFTCKVLGTVGGLGGPMTLFLFFCFKQDVSRSGHVTLGVTEASRVFFYFGLFSNLLVSFHFVKNALLYLFH